MQDPTILLQQNNHHRLNIPISAGALRRRRYCDNFRHNNNVILVHNPQSRRTRLIRWVLPKCSVDDDDDKLGLRLTHEEEEDEDDEVCPAECVREFNKDDEFLRILDKAKKDGSLVVVDFYRTSCGSCKYIEQIFSKMCKGSAQQQASVVFLKHNVMDEYEEQSEVAERLRIKSVPLFHFYKDGVLLEAFPTRDKQRILEAIDKYSNSTPLPL